MKGAHNNALKQTSRIICGPCLRAAPLGSTRSLRRSYTRRFHGDVGLMNRPGFPGDSNS